MNSGSRQVMGAALVGRLDSWHHCLTVVRCLEATVGLISRHASARDIGLDVGARHTATRAAAASAAAFAATVAPGPRSKGCPPREDSVEDIVRREVCCVPRAECGMGGSQQGMLPTPSNSLSVWGMRLERRLGLPQPSAGERSSFSALLPAAHHSGKASEPVPLALDLAVAPPWFDPAAASSSQLVHSCSCCPPC